MPLGSLNHWAVVLPVEKTTLLRNPSLERDATDWSSQTGAAVRASSAQAFGAWSYQIASGVSGTLDIVVGTATAGVGTAYTASLYANVEAGKTLRVGVRTTGNYATGAWLGSSVNTTVSGMQRYSCSYTEASGGGARYVFAYMETASPTTAPFSVDGAMLEAGSISTYIDGDQEGCFWTGAPHASLSTRSGTYRGGGSVIALADLGLKPYQFPGVGMPPQEVTSQSYALQPGAEYQRSRASERPFTLTFQPIMGTTQQDFHITRRRIEDAFKPDLVTPQQPIRFWYTGGLGTIQIDAVYQSGLEFGEMNGPMAEDGAIKFIAHDPFWYATTNEGTSLSSRTSLGSTNFMAYRDPLGKWGTMGSNGTTISLATGLGFAQIFSILPLNTGTVLFGGVFGTVGGTVYPALGAYYTSTNLFGTWTGGTVVYINPQTTAVYDIVQIPSGSVYVGGIFDSAGGTRAVGIAKWNGNFGTFTGGTIGSVSNFYIYDLLYSSLGTLFFAGDFDKVGGTVSQGIGMHNGVGFGTFTGGTINGKTYGITELGNQQVVIVGSFGSAGGTVANNTALWRGSYGTISGGLQDPVTLAYGQTVAKLKDNTFVVGGLFGSASGAPAKDIAQSNGIAFTALGTDGLRATYSPVTYTVLEDSITGDIWAGGRFDTAGGVKVTDGLAIFNRYAWRNADIDLSASYLGGGIGTVSALAQSNDGTIYVGGYFNGTAYAASVAQVINTGQSLAYPTLFVKNTGSGTARIYQILNTTTRDGIYFNLSLLAGEDITLVLNPGNRSLISSFRGNIFNNIIGGSNIATFKLVPGLNYISFFSDSDSITTSFYWKPTSWSNAGGTIR